MSKYWEAFGQIKETIKAMGIARREAKKKLAHGYFILEDMDRVFIKTVDDYESPEELKEQIKRISDMEYEEATNDK